MTRIRTTAGQAIREERRRRRITLRRLAEAAGVGLGTVHAAESAEPCSIEVYVRLAGALRLRLELGMSDPRRRPDRPNRQADQVHAAMGEAMAAHFREIGLRVGMDEPFQHYQFAGRADVIAWSAERQALLHIENRTEFPDVQDAFGRFNGKRRFLGGEIAAQMGVAGWRSETHVMAALWSADVLRSIRAHRASFAAVCSDSPDAWDAWWHADPLLTGRRSILLVFDPLTGRRFDRRRWAGLSDLDDLRPRYRDYADAADALKADHGARGPS